MSETRSANGGSSNFLFSPTYELDITSYVCPMTFVKTKLQLEDMESGETLGLKIRRGESYNNVTRSVRDEGHSILAERPLESHVVELLIEKGKD